MHCPEHPSTGQKTVPPWPWPLVNLLDTPEKHNRLELIWKETEQVRSRYVTSLAGGANTETINCDLCGELFTVGDTATLVEDCNVALCNPRARAHMDCILLVDEDIPSGGWCCGVCNSEEVADGMEEAF